jgi:poly-gamma-glutamate synthesis protein (capsule biosynthesis protein)
VLTAPDEGHAAAGVLRPPSVLRPGPETARLLGRGIMKDRVKNTALSILFLLALASCRIFGTAGFPDEPPPGAYAEMSRQEEPGYLSIVAAGDNLFHETIVAAFKGKEGYNFSPVYEAIKPVIEGADLAFINQETVLGRESFGYSGYPRFNTPQVLAKNLADAGFDIINQANNHIMDMGETGVRDTIAAWDAIPGTSCLGIHRSPEEREGRNIIIEKNGIRAGFLAYTYGTNGLPLPGDKPYLVSLIETETMSREIGALRPLCDFLIVSMHWGEEYAPSPSAGQIALAEFLAAREVDLVIGHHPHVLQPAALLPRPGGGQMLCFYSLGNFMSGQRQADTMLGGLMYVKLSKSKGNTALSDAGIIPVVTHYGPGSTGYRVYPLYQYTDDILKRHRLHKDGTGLNTEYFYSTLNKLNTKIIMYNPFKKD